MPKVTLVHPDLSRTEIDARVGAPLMQAAIAACVEEILAECGGGAMCATCHVIVDDSFAHRLPPPSPSEEEMLSCLASPREPTSRLSCQIAMTDDLDGLIVRLPDRQT